MPRFKSHQPETTVNQQLLAEIGRTQRLEILNTLKRTRGLSVNRARRENEDELHGNQTALPHARARWLSRYLATPAKNGPPGDGLPADAPHPRSFPGDSNDFTLDLLQSIKEIHGPNAPEKLLYNLFERKTNALKAKVKGSTVEERAKSLANIRDEEGHMSQFVNDASEGGPQILECHSPIMNLIEQYEIIGRLEQDMFEEVLRLRCDAKKPAPPDSTSAAFYFAL